MIDKIIAYSIRNKFVIGLLVLALIVWGLFSLRQLPIDAVPDITNNQVQIITISPKLATMEVEQFITTPVELSLQNLQGLVEIRSISRFGLSVVTVVFEENMDIYLARQLVSEHLDDAAENIPEGLGTPGMGPITTGLGEIYQYVIRPEEGYEDKYSLTDLRTIQDWIVRRQLSGIDGVVEVNTMGGYLKQYEVAVNPSLLKSMGIKITDVFEALENSNENTGGAYIEKNPNTYYIRTNGIAKTLKDIEEIVVDVRNGRPILIKDVATVQFGKAPRYGALTRDGAEAVGGRVLMLKGANSAAVTERVKERVEQVKKSLPEGVIIEPYLVRDKLVKTAIGTVEKNLLEGGLIVIFILVLMLGNFRAGLIVASVIPLSMLFAVSMMNVFGISANLMSLGAIDFGLIVDGAVIIVEAIVHRLQINHAGKQLSIAQMDEEVRTAAVKIRSSAAFGEVIILMVYIPILALVGIEGKMFKPMAQTVMLAISGALILSLTYVPMMSAWFLNKKVSNKRTIADRIIAFNQRLYLPLLNMALRFKTTFVIATVALFAFSLFTFSRMGGEFIPTLEEGDLAMQHILPPGTSLSQSIEISKFIQNRLREEFPEILDVVTNMGAAEIPTDPMPVEIGDYILIMKPKEEWTSASSRQEMFEKIEESLQVIPGVNYEFSQPIQMRFNELMTGTRADIAIKLYGQDLDLLYAKAKEAERHIRGIDGVGTVNVEQTVGMPQVVIDYKYDKMAQYGLKVKDVNQVIRMAFAGEAAGVIYEGERRFDLVVRLDEKYRRDLENIELLFVPLENGSQVPLREVADVRILNAPMQISRDNTNRRIVIGVNVGDTDVETLVSDIQKVLDENVELPPGYFFTYGGQFENLKAANARLRVAVPIALSIIFILLYFTFGSVSQALLIFTAIPLSAIGGVWALELRDMPFSISAGIGFIALFGVAVLNGIVLIGYLNRLKKEGVTNLTERIIKGTMVRLRPVLMTASVASLGFLPMALSTSGGAEVQRPLATVVIGGLISATFLTMVILPILYYWLERWKERRQNGRGAMKTAAMLLPLLFVLQSSFAQQRALSLDQALQTAENNNPAIRAGDARLEQSMALRNLPYSPGMTEFNYQGEGLYSKNNQLVHQFGLVQQFNNPAVTKAQNAFQENVINNRLIERELTLAGLRLQVRQTYYTLQQKKELQGLYRWLTEMYGHYYEIARKRVQLGAANALETLTIQSAMNEYLLLEKQNAIEISSLEKQFRLLLNTPDSVTTADSLKLTPLAGTPAERVNTLRAQLAEQQVNLETARVQVIKSALKPSLTLGYGFQNFYESGWLNAITAGVQIPLFNKPVKKRLEAQQMQIQAAMAGWEAEKLNSESQLQSALSAVRMYADGVAYYQQQLEAINPEIDRVSQLNYHAGEISYLELLNTLQLMGNNYRSYLEQLLAYNRAVAFYQFLSNQ
ncbi:MAG: CusA/CzcA family heavy metal efflux RND transporter [Saprospirales bacterium]|nr:CusA/CzcA family heavy metal efflux RND transporter [Saprospirales bacterium]